MAFSSEDFHNIMEQNIAQLNLMIPSYSKVSAFKLMDNEFAKTPKKSIKRYLYKDEPV